MRQIRKERWRETRQEGTMEGSLVRKERRRNARWRRNEGEESNRERRMKMNQMRIDGEYSLGKSDTRVPIEEGTIGLRLS
jgi:hypothetical protein